jgi:hypothetical protein
LNCLQTGGFGFRKRFKCLQAGGFGFSKRCGASAPLIGVTEQRLTLVGTRSLDDVQYLDTK